MGKFLFHRKPYTRLKCFRFVVGFCGSQLAQQDDRASHKHKIDKWLVDMPIPVLPIVLNGNSVLPDVNPIVGFDGSQKCAIDTNRYLRPETKLNATTLHYLNLNKNASEKRLF